MVVVSFRILTKYLFDSLFKSSFGNFGNNGEDIREYNIISHSTTAKAYVSTYHNFASSANTISVNLQFAAAAAALCCWPFALGSSSVLALFFAQLLPLRYRKRHYYGETIYGQFNYNSKLINESSN